MKNRINKIAQTHNKNPEELFDQIMTKFCQGNHPKNKNPWKLEEYLIEKEKIARSDIIEPKLTELKSKVFPILQNNEAFSKYDNNFEDIIKYSTQENAVLGLAHPGFTLQNFPALNAGEELTKLIEKSNGQIKLAEKFHQAYPIPREISTQELENYNKILDKSGLISIGGRDNESLNFCNF